MHTSKSMQFVPDHVLSNGHYFEDIIDGYTTIDVEGRESLTRDITATSVGTRDGNIYGRKQYSSRTLKVSFCIEGEDTTELLDKLDTLNYYLDMEECYYIFDDEPDKFYVGTPSGSPSFSIAMAPSSGMGVASGSFEILCSNPFKYSVDEQIIEFDTDSNPKFQSATVNYEGTRKAYPKFEVLFANPDGVEAYGSESGYLQDYEYISTIRDNYDGHENYINADEADSTYISIMDQSNNILQFGNPDASSTTVSNTVEDQKFDSSGNYSSAVQSRWLTNTSGPTSILPTGYTAQGSFAMAYREDTVTQNGVTTEGDILNATGTIAPKFTYSLRASATARRSNQVDISVTVNWTKPKGAAFSKATLTAAIGLYDASNPQTFTNLAERQFLTKAIAKGTKTSSSFTMKFTVTEISASTDNIDLQFKVTSSKDDQAAYNQAGELSPTQCLGFPIPTYLPPQSGSCYLAASSFGTVQAGEHRGPTITRYLSSSEVCKNFEFDTDLYLASEEGSIGTLQRGSFICMVVTGDSITSTTITNPKKLAGFVISDSDSGSTDGTIDYYINDEIYKSSTINLNYYIQQDHDVTVTELTGYKNGSKSLTVEKYEAYTKSDKSKYKPQYTTTTTHYNNEGDNRPRAVSITKDESEIKITITNMEDVVYPIDSTLKDKQAYAVMIGCFNDANYPTMKWMGITSAKFIKYPNGSSSEAFTISSVSNLFGTGDKLIADTQNADIYLNSERLPSIGALGNAWDSMYLIPGLNKYYGTCSLIDNAASASDYPELLFKCKGQAYIPCTDADWVQNGTTYYTRTSNGTYAIASTPTEEVFNLTYTNYYMLEWIDEWNSEQTYYNSAGTQVSPTQAQYEAAPWNYYIKKSAVPRFRIRYREVFI